MQFQEYICGLLFYYDQTLGKNSFFLDPHRSFPPLLPSTCWVDKNCVNKPILVHWDVRMYWESSSIIKIIQTKEFLFFFLFIVFFSVCRSSIFCRLLCRERESLLQFCEAWGKGRASSDLCFCFAIPLDTEFPRKVALLSFDSLNILKFYIVVLCV